MDGTSRTRRRLPRNERERLIVDNAIRFFAEVGFEGQTRALAERLGVTQPLLYRYFPDKEALIDRVFSEVFTQDWNPEWETDLTDPAIPLLDRIVTFYRNFQGMSFSYERVRLFMFACLRDHVVAKRYLTFIRDHIFIPLAREIRRDAGLDTSQIPSDREIECIAGLHGAIGYIGLRRWIYRDPALDDCDRLMRDTIACFLNGTPNTFASSGSALPH